MSRPAAAPGGAFRLSRFMASCCAADAIPFTIRVVPGAGLAQQPVRPADTWLTVSGTLRESRTGEWIVVADRIREQERPANPYL